MQYRSEIKKIFSGYFHSLGITRTPIESICNEKKRRRKTLFFGSSVKKKREKKENTYTQFVFHFIIHFRLVLGRAHIHTSSTRDVEYLLTIDSIYSSLSLVFSIYSSRII
jgi:hypothetical protein